MLFTIIIVVMIAPVLGIMTGHRKDLTPAYANLWRSVKTGLFSWASVPESL